MISPSGWEEPGQRPEFEEITVVLKGMLRVEHEHGVLDVHAGQGSGRRARGMGALQHARSRRGGIRRGLPAGVLADDRPPRRITGATGPQRDDQAVADRNDRGDPVRVVVKARSPR